MHINVNIPNTAALFTFESETGKPVPHVMDLVHGVMQQSVGHFRIAFGDRP